jgi:hypothetical protein
MFYGDFLFSLCDLRFLDMFWKSFFLLLDTLNCEFLNVESKKNALENALFSLIVFPPWGESLSLFWFQY